nr:berberine bridge enzyme-like 8 [Tanacetum cinerariifolium]
DFIKSPISKHGMESIFNKMKELKNQMITFNPLGGRMTEISEFAKPYPRRPGNLAKIEYETYWNDPGTEATNEYLEYSRLMHEHMTPRTLEKHVSIIGTWILVSTITERIVTKKVGFMG